MTCRKDWFHKNRYNLIHFHRMPQKRNISQIWLFRSHIDWQKFRHHYFQLLNEKRGMRDVYKMFFDIDIMDNLDDDLNNSYRKWEKLLRLFDDRHAIIHKGKDTNFSKEDIREIIDSIGFLKTRVMEKILTPYQGSIQ